MVWVGLGAAARRVGREGPLRGTGLTYLPISNANMIYLEIFVKVVLVSVVEICSYRLLFKMLCCKSFGVVCFSPSICLSYCLDLMEPNKWVGSSSSACLLEESLQSILLQTFDSVSDAQSFLLLNNISVFSFTLLDLSSDGLENSGFEFQRPVDSWPQALFLRNSQSPLITSGFSVSGIITDTSDQLTSYATYVLLIKMSVDDTFHSAHLLSLEHAEFKCINEFYFVELYLDVNRFLWGITKLVFQRHSLPQNYQPVLTTALLAHNSNSFVDRIYLLIFLAFAYPLFGATPSLMSYLQIGDVSANIFWYGIIHLVLERNSRLSFLSSRTENAVLREIDCFIREFHLCRVWQGYDCHPLEMFLRDISNFSKC